MLIKLLEMGFEFYGREIDVAHSLWRNGWTAEEIGMKIREMRREEKEVKRKESLAKARARYKR